MLFVLPFLKMESKLNEPHRHIANTGCFREGFDLFERSESALAVFKEPFGVMNTNTPYVSMCLNILLLMLFVLPFLKMESKLNEPHRHIANTGCFREGFDLFERSESALAVFKEPFGVMNTNTPYVSMCLNILLLMLFVLPFLKMESKLNGPHRHIANTGLCL